jgi:hypothetical protein
MPSTAFRGGKNRLQKFEDPPKGGVEKLSLFENSELEQSSKLTFFCAVPNYLTYFFK